MLHHRRHRRVAGLAPSMYVASEMTTPASLSVRVLWAAAAMLAAAATTAHAQTPRVAAADSARRALEREAVTLLQGQDTLPFIHPRRVRLVAGALAAIRRKLPVLADIPAGPDQGSLVLYAPDSAPAVFAERSGTRPPPSAPVDAWSAPVARAGIPELDSLNRVFGVAGMTLRSTFGRTALALRFARPVNVPIAAESYARLPVVGRAVPPEVPGDGSWIALIPKGRRLHFVFARGSEECASGCITWDYYYVTFDSATRAVSPDSQLLGASKWPLPVAYWDVPTRYDITPYRTVDDLYAALAGDARWWHRQHALVVLGMLLGLDAEQWYGPPERRAPAFAALERAALARRRDSFAALIARLGDRDRDVARLAHVYLRALTGAELPGGAAAIPAWRQWLERQPDGLPARE